MESVRRLYRAGVGLLTAVMVAAACSSPVPDTAGTPAAGGNPGIDGSVATEVAALPQLQLANRPGPFQITIDQAGGVTPPGTELDAIDARGRTVARATVADNGTALLRTIPPGPVWVRQLDQGRPTAALGPVSVPGDEAPPDAEPDRARLVEGFNYITTRDGTTLSAHVTLPGNADGGPYPTLVEYSGYSPSQPSGADPGRFIVPALGYALVQVNVRGTGCSGGSFDVFEPIQHLDGYDVIETVAAQGWSGSVGMYGISYAGIMQLLVAGTRPPSLDAIAPLSVLDELSSVLYPGGIYNSGFAETWVRDVAAGATAYGQGWERDRVEGGDTTCEANQRLRVHNPDPLESLLGPGARDEELLDDRSPLGVAGAIEVPVFLAGAWQDEQTGATWPNLINALSGAETIRVVMYNGVHADSIAPDLLAEVTEFYDLFLGDSDPGASPLVGLAMSSALATVYGAVLPFPFKRFDPEEAGDLRRVYQEADPIRIRFEHGATSANLPVAGFEVSFGSWPPEEVEATTFSFSPAGPEVAAPSGDPGSDPGRAFALTEGGPDGESEASFTTVPAEGSVTTATDQARLVSNDPGWTWPVAAPGAALQATTTPLDQDLVLVGPARADLWVSADAPDGDIEVTLSEIAPDGSETYIQTGWLRLSRRSPVTTRPDGGPVDDPAPLTGGPPGGTPLVPSSTPVLARVEIPPFAHVLRAGSQLRATIDTPGASRPSWRFDVDDQPVTITVHSSPDSPSQLVIPVLNGLQVPTPRPGCGDLRGQPCRS